MKELICPNCHKAFTVDEADYASIVNQVKNAEFNAEVDRRIAELHDRHKAAHRAYVGEGAAAVHAAGLRAAEAHATGEEEGEHRQNQQ